MWRFGLVLALTIGFGASMARADDKDDCGNSVNAADQAITACTKLVDSGGLSGPDLAFAFHNRAIAYHVKGDLDHAMTDYDQAIALDPKNPLQHSNRGLAYSSRGDLARAIADYDDAIRLEPNNPINFRYRGYAYYQKGAHWTNGTLPLEALPSLFYTGMAIADFGKAIQINAADADAYFNRGLAFAGRGQRDEAIADFKKALEIKPDYADASQALQSMGVQP